MATPAQRTNTWILDEWYDQAVAGTTGGYNGENQLWTWGENDTGGAGSNNTTNYSSPIQISGTTWANATGSFRHSAGIKNDGTLWSWGYNYYGELGLNGPTPSQRSSPTQIPGTTWSDVSTGNEFMLAKKTDGTLWSWGQNDRGQLGTNQGPAQLGGASSPIQVGTDTDWNKMTGGTYRSFAIKTDGTLWAFGRNDYGYLGQNNTTQYSSPVQIPGTWDNGVGSSYAAFWVKTDGTGWRWGRNEYGQLAQNDRTYRSSPIQIPGVWNNAKVQGRQNANFSLGMKA